MNTVNTRIGELDYLKCVFIILMIVFHLVYIGDTYPVAKQFVYTFHMPGFLIISGFLLNVNKSERAFLRSMWWIFVPYALMETGYTVMASLLPIREHVDNLSGGLLLEHILVSPMGPYWYLHTLLLCSLVAYFAFRCFRLHVVVQLAVLAIGFWCMSRLQLVVPANAAYFFVGVVIAKSGVPFLDMFRPTALSLLPLVGLVVMVPDSLDRSAAGGIMIVYFVISFLLWTYRYLPEQTKKTAHFIGRNTLVILLFSPLFTITAKYMQPFLAFEPTGMLFMVLAVLLALAGCFFIAFMMDKLHVSRYIFGRAVVIR